MLKSKIKALRDAPNPVVRSCARAAFGAYHAFMDSRLVYCIKYKPFMSDEKYIRRLYKKTFGVEPNLENPVNFNEKNNWRKLHDRKPIYTDIVDKLKFKDFVRSKAGEGHTFPLIASWDKPQQINFSALPERYVLKGNHCGGVYVCRDKSSFDTKSVVKELNKTLHQSYFWQSREWPYKNVERKILCEQYMGENLTDYKNYCFNGKLMYTFVWENIGREDGRKPRAYFCGAYDRDWNKTTLSIGYDMFDKCVEKPQGYEEMVALAEKLSEDIPFVRVDCYIVDGKVYAGEMTFFPWGGFQKFDDEQWNLKLGNMQTLPPIDQ